MASLDEVTGGMRRFWLCMAAVVGVLALAMALTLRVPSLGGPLWHYNVAFAVALVGAAAAWPLLRHRRVATFSMAVTGVVATATGFVMLYTKELPFKEWFTWWHSVTSFALLLAFLAHWFHNHPRLVDFTSRLFTRTRVIGFTAAGAWVGLLALGVWTGMADVRVSFTRENYAYLSTVALFVGISFTYGLWLAYRLPPLQARLRQPGHRTVARALVDTGLFLANWGALLTGFALLYFADFLRAGSWKYVSKWWHTAASVAFLALVALHVGFNARLLRAHARRIDSDLR